MIGLPSIKANGKWESGPHKFGSFEFKGEIITINTTEKYLYWNKKLDSSDDEDIQEMLDTNDHNFGKLWKAMESFLYITHRIDDHHWDK